MTSSEFVYTTVKFKFECHIRVQNVKLPVCTEFSLMNSSPSSQGLILVLVVDKLTMSSEFIYKTIKFTLGCHIPIKHAKSLISTEFQLDPS